MAGDTNGVADIFMRDRQNGTTERISIADDEDQAVGASLMTAVSADGRFVAFQSEAANLVGGDTNAPTDIFVRDRTSGTTERVSVATGGSEAHDDCDGVDISGDGRRVVFGCSATNLVTGDATAPATSLFATGRAARPTGSAS